MISKLKKRPRNNKETVEPEIDKIGVMSLVFRAGQHAVRKAARAHGNLVTFIVKIALRTLLVVVNRLPNFASHFSTTISSL
jgi:hypothetical protein